MRSIYTKTGDKGETSLFGGSRISKDNLQVECYGTVDEANSMIGVAYSLVNDDEIKNELRNIQKKLFVLGAEIASDSKGIKNLTDKIVQRDIELLEKTIDKYTKKIGIQDSFIIPGGDISSSTLHMARTVVRRSERLVIALNKQAEINTYIKKYLNRLSDLLFIMARIEEKCNFIQEVKLKVLDRLKDNKKELDISLKLSKRMAEAIERKAVELGVPVVFTVMDSGGNIVLVHRMENSLLASIDISMNKAYTALALNMSTDKVSEIVKEDSELYGIQWSNKGKIVPFGGGYPLKHKEKVIGGIGVSGGTVEEDISIAINALKVFDIERS
ncbi:cob(I)yrinic acid a,c-diamide adenosyltransferase [Clostridium sp. D2Q-14]|uniref:cob(I)yrinic acid a,c-diamide adenosyltransferase n=1 Tax=Anaeromonas gelatinilytica TaxID=2683194 RepID=UPI00193B7AA2|nr:cob(I)yrinic acid a,c-diamide adenosyltransferase [Anaeromonas gelatinilytica]MBS4534536.1 cob(I)yrinic acid a,c-diamide adenosyltransferase [Anaeromonas gelatinilytica]